MFFIYAKIQFLCLVLKKMLNKDVYFGEEMPAAELVRLMTYKITDQQLYYSVSPSPKC